MSDRTDPRADTPFDAEPRAGVDDVAWDDDEDAWDDDEDAAWEAAEDGSDEGAWDASAAWASADDRAGGAPGRGLPASIASALAPLRARFAGRLPVLLRRQPPPPDERAEGLRGLAASELAALPIAGLTKRRVAFAIGVLIAAWVAFAFVRQVSEAAAISARADEMRAANAALAERVAAAERELAWIQGTTFVEQQARAYRLGSPEEIPFALAADPAPLGPDAPGSAANRVGAEEIRVTPLESWLSILFGPVR